ncbi:TauD/TfdA family dioxygenase [Phenylobacterium sp.]|uniref:TauD/TfdA family dioxygenase n=1 Tax=Phenylobacterium sp. TaxID=1871053 RepID=UPI003521884F
MTPKTNGVNADQTLAALRRYATATEVNWSTGDILLIDNWRCLHGRAEAACAPSRVLRRWQLGEDVGLGG